MTRWSKILFINLSVFLLVAIGIDLTFYSLLKVGWLQPRTIEQPYYKSLFPDEVYKIYGNKPFEIPKNISSKNEYNWNLLNKKVPADGKSFVAVELAQLYRTELKDTYLHEIRRTLETVPEEIYNKKYYLNADGLRDISQKPHSSKTKPEKFILHLGDSFTFGQGVDDDKTFPKQLETALHKKYKSYNFGAPGFGAQEVLYRLRNHADDLNWIKESSGKAIYFFIPEHLDRMFCRLQCARNKSMTLDKQRVRFEKGNIEFVGFTKDHLTFEENIAKLMSFSNTLDYLNINWPESFSEQQLKLFSQTLVAIKNEIVKTKNLDQFIFINTYPFVEKEKLFQLLQSENFVILDFSEIPYPLVLKYSSIPIDGHPTSDFYYMLAHLVADRLN